MGVGGLLALAVTPVFSLAYFEAYGGPQESPPGWLANLISTLTDRGWLGGVDPESQYNGYGRFYGLFLLMVLVGLLLLLRHRPHPGRWSAWGWATVVVGMGLATLGTFGDYSGVGALSSLFLFELLGFLVVAVGTVLLGVSLWREEGRRSLGSLVAAVGPASLILGSAATGHFPSGPALLLMAAAIAVSILGLWRTPGSAN
jgi:hypothetical protein